MAYRLGILISHPIQYYAPWFRYLVDHLDIVVFYAHRQDSKGQANAGFGVEFNWDVPLLEGYPFRWLKNVAKRPGVHSFGGCDTPEVFDVLRTERFDAFLVFGWNRKSAIQTILACWRNNVPVLMRGDSQLVSTRSKTTLALKYAPYRCFLPRLDAHLYVGQRNKAYLRHYGVPEHRLFFVPHFVDTGLFAQGAREAETSGVVSEIRARLGIPQHAFVFLFVGKMIPKKRPGDFIEACLKIFKLSGGSHVRALLVGDGPLRSSLENLAEPAAHQVHFAGFQNQRELPAMYKAANALVLPSDGDETWGLVVNEAFACGIPAVVSDACGCAPDLIEEGRTGYTFPVGDVGSLSQRMLALKEFCDKKPAVLSQALAKKTSVYSMEKATEGLVRALSMVTKTQATAKVPFGTVKTKD